MDQKKIIALLTDFGLDDHFVATMKAVILSIDQEIPIFDISHNIQPQNILEASYTLYDTLLYWPVNTLFVVVVDPGVGTRRNSLAAVMRSGHEVICPDNGLLSIVEKRIGIKDVRIINEMLHRKPGSEHSYTFHGRDIYAYNGGRVASGAISIEDLGLKIKGNIKRLAIDDPVIGNKTIKGTVIKMERPFGNISTNIKRSHLEQAGIKYDDPLSLEILGYGKEVIDVNLSFVKTFAEVDTGKPLGYIDSSGRFGLAINQGNFTESYNMGAGTFWTIRIKRAEAHP